MRPESFQVCLLRNVIDSGPIARVASTSVVGKNEADKSSVIDALHGLNPAKPCLLVLLDDYSLWLKNRNILRDGTSDFLGTVASTSRPSV